MKEIWLQNLLKVFLIIIITASCNKDKINYDPNEVIVTINASNLGEGFRTFFVVENKKSNAISTELVEGENSILRGDEILGDLVNFHFVYIDNDIDDFWRIKSYYDISIGKEINLPDMYGAGKSDVEVSKSKGVVNISFADIPDFDIATRSAHYPGHCHTNCNLEVPCANIGGNTYSVGDNFYVCLQKGKDAGYIIVSVPEVDEYVISLGELNYDMTKYSILKNPNQEQHIKVGAYGSDGLIEIFNLRSPEVSLFPGDSIDVFVPNGLPQMKNFSTLVYNTSDDYFLYSYYFSNQVTTKHSFLDVGLSLSHTSGEFPLVSAASDKYDILELLIQVDHNFWTIYASDGQSLYTPEFPDEVLQAISDDFQLLQLLSANSSIVVEAIDDSRFNNYDDALEYYLKIRDFEEENYSILYERKWR